MWFVSVLVGLAAASDQDGDSVPDDDDVCPGIADPAQAESSVPPDGAGDACADPRSWVDPTATMFGAYIAAKARVEADASVGMFTVVGRRSIVHDGATLGDDVHLAADVVVGAGAVIESGGTLGYGVSVGPGVVVGAGATVGTLAAVYADVGAGARIGRSATVEGPVGVDVLVDAGVVIEAGATVQSGAKLHRGVRVRDGAMIGDNARIGRGVDVGQGADIGARAVVRAGAIVPDGAVVLADTTLARGETAPVGGAGSCDASEAYVSLRGGFSPNSSYGYGQIRRVDVATGVETLVQPAVPFVEEMFAYAGGPLYAGFGRRQPNASLVDPALGLSLARMVDPAGAIELLVSHAGGSWEYYPNAFALLGGDLLYGVNSYTSGPAVDRYVHRYDFDLDVDARVVTRACCSMEIVASDWDRGFLTFEGETLLRYDGVSVATVAGAAEWGGDRPNDIAVAPDGTFYGSHMDFDFSSFPFSTTSSIRRFALDGTPPDVVVTAIDGREDYEVIDMEVDCEGDLWVLVGMQQPVGPRLDRLYEIPGGTGFPALRYTATGGFSTDGFTISR